MMSRSSFQGAAVGAAPSPAWGAGAGVMILALTLLATSEPLWRAAMLKSYALGLANLVAAVGFAVFGPVHWPAAIIATVICIPLASS